MASRTGRREACQAGRKLATVPRQIETTSHISVPLGSKKKSRPTLNMILTSKSPTVLLTGQAASVASDQLTTPITTHAMITRSHTSDGATPIARNTPISRRRSSTFRLIVVISPRLPTPARMPDTTIRKIDHHHVLVGAKPEICFAGAAERSHAL